MLNHARSSHLSLHPTPNSPPPKRAGGPKSKPSMNGGAAKASEPETPPPPPPDMPPKQGNLISKPSDVGDSSASLKDLLIEQGECLGMR